MMLLLQCPWPKISPSRNQTPGAISFTVFASASLRVTTKPSESTTTNPALSNKRTRLSWVDYIEVVGQVGKLPPIENRPWCRVQWTGRFSIGGRLPICPTIPAARGLHCYNEDSTGGGMAVQKRRVSVPVKIGNVTVGGNHPIVVQSMTNTDTADVASTVNQVMALAQAGSELVRVTVNTEAAAQAVPKIVDTLDKFGVRVPVIGDFHYNGHILLKKYPDCARALAKYRINPGNVNIGKKPDDNFPVMIDAAVEYDRPMRIGVTWGSLDQALLTRRRDED